MSHQRDLFTRKRRPLLPWQQILEVSPDADEIGFWRALPQKWMREVSPQCWQHLYCSTASKKRQNCHPERRRKSDLWM